jgi:hypothetical protein
VPEVSAQRKLGGGRYEPGIVAKTVQSALENRFGTGNWVSSILETGSMVYLNLELIRAKGLDRAEVDRAAAEAARSIPHIFRVYTREQIMSNQIPGDIAGQAVLNGFYPARGEDIVVIQEPNWLFGAKGTSHGTPFGYDTHVPVIFMGPGIKPGKYHEPVIVNDIAPTVATMLAIETPSGSVGRVLAEMFTKDVN